MKLDEIKTLKERLCKAEQWVKRIEECERWKQLLLANPGFIIADGHVYPAEANATWLANRYGVPILLETYEKLRLHVRDTTMAWIDAQLRAAHAALEDL
jgi:hypothetical protein